MTKIKGLYSIIDTTFSPQYTHVELAHLMLLGGCKILQLRMKHYEMDKNWHDKVFEVAKDIMKLKNRHDFTFIVNDYVDVAGEVKADGVHVGEHDMQVSEIRKRLGKEIIIGYSSHSIPEAIEAEKRGADYVAFGAIFPTKTKGPGHPVQGIEKLKKLRETISKPIVAIGGIGRSNINDILEAGADSFAMITGLTQAKNIVEEVKWYVEKEIVYSSSLSRR